jgi:superfamily II DNA or RNA helicase
MEVITKKDLLKSDPGLKDRPYQLEALLSIFRYLKCIVKMFCGTGKSRIITNVIIHEKKELSVVVFPSLALINQYSEDYLINNKHFNKHKTINISSEMLPTIESTTDPKQIRTFLKLKHPKIILVTYQSYKVLLDCLDGNKIGLVCYDEAHHVVSPECQTLVFGTTHFEKEVFFTATPKNENGITMFDRDDPDKNMCGPVAYDYTYLQGLNDEVLNPFEICVDMYTENTNNSIYDAMARAILARNTNRVLSFHSGVNGESNTNVRNFVNQPDFEIAFNKVQKAEFPEKANDYKKITFKGMDGATSSADRKAMLKALDNTPSNEIYIIASCETIGEGVDTKKANMCVFADPKSSITKIIQNIGRVVRRNNAQPLSTILIPCWINMENYASANGDRAKQDELIRQNMRSEKGDYASILNVLSALRQEDNELYEMCLNYPNRRVKEESLEEQGFRIDEDEYSAEDVEQMKKDGDPLEIHTDETIERFNEDSSENMTRLYYDAEENVYSPIVRNNDNDSDEETDSDEESESEDDRSVIQPPKPKAGIKMSIHQNDDIQILWGVIGDLDFSQKFCSVVIECEVSFGIEQWYNKLKHVCEYMDKYKKRPSCSDKDAKNKKLGTWIGTQKKNYAKNVYIMTNPVIRAEWEATLKKYAEYFMDGEEAWRSTHQNVCDYMDKYKKRPSEHDKTPEIKKLGKWVSYQKKNYKKNTEIMKNPVIRNEWEVTLKKYAEYFMDGEEVWRSIHKNICEYMDKHKKSPSAYDKDHTIKKLGNWINSQKSKYKKNVEIMKNQIIRAEWESTMKKYAEYLETGEEAWRSTHNKVRDYMDKHNKRPFEKDKDPVIKKLGKWIGTQNGNYKKNIQIMSNPDIRSEWEATLEKYAEYLESGEETWRSTHHKAREYMDKNEKSPSTKDKDPEIKKLGNWVSMQKKTYKKNVEIMKNPVIRNEWEATMKKYAEYLETGEEAWRSTHQNVCDYMDKYKKRPSEHDKTPEIKKLGKWVSTQKKNYTKNVQIMSNPDIRSEWEVTLEKYAEYLKQPQLKVKKQTDIPLPSAESTGPHHFPPPSKIGRLHLKYHRMRSDNLHATFKENPQLWREYHDTRKDTFATYEPSSIPTNQIIRKLEEYKTKRKKVVVDMGCGEAPIAHYFKDKNDTRFIFHNYDHQSGGDPLIQEVDISALPLEDASVEIAIMSLALWGTDENCTQYIKEAYRVLESGGKFYISDSTNKWSPKPLTPENGGDLLRTLLTKNGFVIRDETIGTPFCLFVCEKI